MNVETAASATSKPPIQSKFVKKGSYGCVMRPALPNRDNAGNWHEYPGNITKLYTDALNADKAVSDSGKIQSLMGENAGLKVHTYKHRYQVKNLPENIKHSCGIIGSPYNYVSGVRQANLGIDVQDIIKPENGAIRRQIRELPVSKFIEQVQKVFHQVQNLVKKNYIHGDIRESNFMVNPVTGDLTIIDFDWLYPVDYFFSTYPVGSFYSNPPETLLFRNYERFPASTSTRDNEFIKKLELNTPSKINTYISPYIILFPTINIDFIVKKLQDAKRYLALKGINTKSKFKQYLERQFDIWGLAYALTLLLKNVWPEVYSNTPAPTPSSDVPYAIYEIKKVLSKILTFDIDKRIQIDEAVSEIDKIAEMDRRMYAAVAASNAMSAASISALAPHLNSINSAVGGRIRQIRKKLNRRKRTRKSHMRN